LDRISKKKEKISMLKQKLNEVKNQEISKVETTPLPWSNKSEFERQREIRKSFI